MRLRATSPATLLNHAAPETDVERPDLRDHSAEEIQMWAYEHLTEKQLERVFKHRSAECDLRRAYLETTFTDLILELQDQLNDLQQAQLFGAENSEEQKKLTDRINQLTDRKQQRLDELALMTRLSANLPEVLTSALVVPAPDLTPLPPLRGRRGGEGVPMRRDDEVERIAMEVTIHYEQGRGWTPIDVSHDGEHYDIRSESPTGEKRFIEVKGRAQSGAIFLTGPEVDKLRQLQDRAFLYVVTYSKSERPRLRVIGNPIAQLTPEMLYR